MANTGDKDLVPKGVGIGSWSLAYYGGQLHINKFNNLIYFPYAPINILSGTSLTESIKYDEGT